MPDETVTTDNQSGTPAGDNPVGSVEQTEGTEINSNVHYTDSGGASQSEEQSKIKNSYTIDEMKRLKFDEIDTSRIPEEQLPFYKALQSAATKKFQELAEFRKQAERTKGNREDISQSGPASLQEAFEEDPRRVINYIDEKVAELERKDPYDPEVRRLERLKSNLIFEHQLSLSEQREQDKRGIEAELSIKREIPNFDEKASDITRFVTETLKDDPLTDKELNVLTNPSELGPLAIKLVRLFNTFYDKFGLKEKKVPPRVESPGTGIESKKPSYWEMSEDDFKRVSEGVKMGKLKI